MPKTTIYHASSEIIKNPKHNKGRIDTDFGQGFYASTELEMAEKWACRKNPSVINEYMINTDNLRVYTFSSNKEWLDFVVDNRNMIDMSNSPYNQYDLLIGPTADDKLFSTIEQYETGYISSDIATKILDCMKIGTQYVLKTENAIQELSFCKAYEIDDEKKINMRQTIREERMEAERLTQNILKEEIYQKDRYIPANIRFENRNNSNEADLDQAITEAKKKANNNNTPSKKSENIEKTQGCHR